MVERISERIPPPVSFKRLRSVHIRSDYIGRASLVCELIAFESPVQHGPHRPPDVDQLAAEVRRLHTNGLTPRDIAAALRLAPDAVVTMLWGDLHADTELSPTDRNVR
jgi:hypothetical protein